MLRRALLTGLVLTAVGCGVQQIAPANRRAMGALQTAVSSKKVDWLDATVELIEEQHSNGEMSDAEYAAFEPIIEKARAGDWPGAQKDAFALADGQKPTAEDLENIKPRAEE